MAESIPWVKYCATTALPVTLFCWPSTKRSVTSVNPPGRVTVVCNPLGL
ncbi:MAG TPA: hypothetical protein VF331_21930 [Polyangiales bacterium]